MDVASRNSAVECRSARASSSLEIAYCLSGIVACLQETDAGWLLCIVAAPVWATALYSNGHAFIAGGKALLVLGSALEKPTISGSRPKRCLLCGRYMDSEYLRSSTDGSGRHGIPVTGKIFTSA